TVALSGDGGDELFWGYGRYFRAAHWWTRRQRIPEALRAPTAAVIARAAALMPGGASRNRAFKLAEVLSAPHSAAFYPQFVSYGSRPREVLINEDMPSTRFDEPVSDDIFRTMSLLDVQTYLPDDILVKVDRAAMAASLETRVPLL